MRHGVVIPVDDDADICVEDKYAGKLERLASGRTLGAGLTMYRPDVSDGSTRADWHIADRRGQVAIVFVMTRKKTKMVATSPGWGRETSASKSNLCTSSPSCPSALATFTCKRPTIPSPT